MPIATIEKLAAKIPGLKLINAYGSTETASPSTIMPPELTVEHIDSVGLPCPGADVIVVGSEGRELPRGEIGEIWIHGSSVIKGYWNNPKATAESFTGGFWHSGRSRFDRRAEFRARVRSPEGHDQPRRTEDLFGRSRIGACRASRRGRERDHRKAMPGAGRARACRDRDPRSASAARRCAPGAPSGCRTTRCRRRSISPPSRCRATPTAR